MQKTVLAAAVLAGLAVPALAETDDQKWLTPTMVNARAAMMTPELSLLTFQHMDTIFATRPVRAGGSVWALASEPGDIGNTFALDGQSLPLDDFLEKTATNGLLVIRDGKIVSEIYRNGLDEKAHHISFSMAKSMLATMVGIAVSEGKIKSLDDKVVDYLPDWKNSAYADVSIRDLLMMRSGVAWLEVYEFGSDTQLTEVHNNSLVAYQYRWCDYAEDRAKTENKPGEVFNYSTLDTSVLGCVLEKATGMKGADYLSEKIWKPAGMETDAFYMLDGPDTVGREFFGAGMNAALRDYGRFGLMMLDDGKANGRQVVPAEWVKRSTVPDAATEPASKDDWLGYAYQWWTVPGSDAYAAIGLFNQFIYIDPPSRTVIVKLDSPADPLGFEKENIAFFEQIVKNIAN
ncbi:hypothetical protein DFR48_102437 [Ciceribacter lividus]|uniref:Beta-lactamase-related domain-containing protein n=1 Tax=Ciceribacter lividus TaxID=1197950 RepID=A0A6I7HQL8_9HYPH|nr:serine hydrolase [Ciceribacter lividus]RCW27943.1 hypothetical protein DFR48_102437 [Ciceribacter lividus]